MARVVVCRVGTGDNFVPAVSPADTLLELAVEQPGVPTSVGTTVRQQLERTALTPPPVTVDLLNLATAVYSADVCTQRVTAFDRWTREFHLYMPVTQPEVWQAASPHLSRMLSFLSGDRWQVEFRPLVTPIPPVVKRKRAKAPSRPSAVSLFSGGLDSFVGVLDLLEAGHTVGMVGHYSTGPTSQAQDAVRNALAEQYGNKGSFHRFYVRPPKLNGVTPEPSTRSRSILFLALGTLVASAFGEPLPLYVPENGLISLNVPLTPARTGTLSTRTTHPYFIALFRELLRLVGIGTRVETPYRFDTKGEMLAAARNPAVLRAVARRTLSCSHPDVGRYHRVAPGQHCGYCVPCIIRRASMAHVGEDRAEDYLIDVRRNPPGAGTETGKDFRAFEMALARPTVRYRAVLEVLNSGPLPPDDVTAYAAVYHRGMDEVRRFLSLAGSA